LSRLSQDSTPVLLYNTYITTYFPEKRPLFRQIMSDWASQRPFPVLWIQCEAWYEQLPSNEKPPESGWCAWTADLWQQGTHKQFLLGWIHPHGQNASFLSGLRDWQQHCLR